MNIGKLIVALLLAAFLMPAPVLAQSNSSVAEESSFTRGLLDKSKSIKQRLSRVAVAVTVVSLAKKIGEEGLTRDNLKKAVKIFASLAVRSKVAKIVIVRFSGPVAIVCGLILRESAKNLVDEAFYLTE